MIKLSHKPDIETKGNVTAVKVLTEAGESLAFQYTHAYDLDKDGRIIQYLSRNYEGLSAGSLSYREPICADFIALDKCDPNAKFERLVDLASRLTGTPKALLAQLNRKDTNTLVEIVGFLAE